MDKEESNQVIKPSTSWKFWTQRRYIFSILVFFGYFNIYSLRANLSIAIVAMTSDRYKTLSDGSQINLGPEFGWNNKIQGYLLSSFFYGYLMTQLLGGYLAAKYGGKIIFGGGVACTAVFTLLSPLLAESNVYYLLSARIFMGVFEGLTYSSLYCLWAKWIPPLERTRTTGQANSGSYSGTVFSMMFYAYLVDVAGWRSVFYFSGALGIIWYLVWLTVIEENPENDSRISLEELEYIQCTLKDSTKSEEKYPIPWKHIFTSKCTWALNVALFCETWGFYTLMTLLPKYYKDVFNFEISKSGVLSALPYLVIAIMMQVTGLLADYIVRSKKLTITQTRKIFIAVGFFSQGCFLLGAAFWGDATGTVFCLVMALGVGSFAISTITVNSLDISPKFSSVIFGIANTWGTVPGIISPIIAGYIVSTENPMVEQWQIVFYIAAGLYIFGAVVYSIFATGQKQPWDETNENKVEDNVKINNGDICSETTQL